SCGLCDDGGDIEGCMDDSACNYNDNANVDDGTCTYPSGCDNACGSTLENDECGVCGGDGIAEGACDCAGNVDLGCGCDEAGPSGCDNACGSTLVDDDCGVCDGGNADQDCAGVCFGSLTDDTFGICGGDGTLQGAIDAADDGDTILVPSGTYTESISITKAVNVSCNGECTIDARGVDGRAVVIDAGFATLDGFTIPGDDTMYAGVVVTPSCTNVTVSNNTIYGMTLSNPGNDSPLSYGILAYGSSATEMPIGSIFSGNNIFGVSGSAISLGDYTYATTISGNNLHDIIPVVFLDQYISVGVQAQFAGEVAISDNSFSNLIIAANLPLSQGSMSGNTHSNVGSYLTTTLPSQIVFSDDVDYWAAQSTIEVLGTTIVLESLASSLELAISVADEGSIIVGSDGSETAQDCAGAWGGDSALDDCGVCDGGNADDLGCGCFEAGPSGCDNECGSTAELDACGICGGWVPDSYICDGSSEYGNAGWGADCPDGSDEGEQCCDTGSSAYGDCSELYGCDDVFNSGLVDDCAGNCDGSSELDYCGVCDGGN
ncbi:MAG: hypothetical protein VB817_06435, partial [Pirellulaceae bacterium]